MASAAGRRNILRELNESTAPGTSSNLPGVSFPPTPTSPEEEIIKLRGRRKMVQFDPDESPVKIGSIASPKKTPTKRLNTPTKLTMTPIRSSPRKRLNLGMEPNDLDEIAIADMEISNKRAKKPKWQNLAATEMATFDKGLMALSPAQLVEVITSAARTSPEVKQVIEQLLPAPDLLPMEQKLYNFRKNIFKAYPRNIWGTQDAPFCYVRVRTHIDVFKKECLDQCRLLMESQHWPAVVEYVLMALTYAKSLPDWASAAHNKAKEFCIRQLVTQLVNAVKKAAFQKTILQEVVQRLKEIDLESELGACIQMMEKLHEEV